MTDKSLIFHICPRSAWTAAKSSGAYQGDTLLSEGFIHCSTKDQVVMVAHRLFRGVSDLVLLVIDEATVQPPVKYEDDGNGTFFPHIYGPLNLDAVIDVTAFPPEADGTFVLPAPYANRDFAP